MSCLHDVQLEGEVIFQFLLQGFDMSEYCELQLEK